MLPILAMLVALGCAAASARRVWLAANATAFHPTELVDALRNFASGGPERPSAIGALRALVAREPSAEWERDLLDAFGAPQELRVARVNEQLTELDYLVERWSRVPRVCARFATTFGFMLATLALRKGLGGPLPTDPGELFVRGLVGEALTVISTGLIGTAFCVGAHAEAKRIARARMKGADELVEWLEAHHPVNLPPYRG